MQSIPISDDQFDKLSAAAQAAGYGDVPAFISALADKSGHDSARRVTDVADLVMPEHLSVDDLATQQGIGPVADFKDLKANFYPPGETTDEFLSFLAEARLNDAPRVR